MAAIYLLPNTLGQDNFDYIIPKDVVNIIDSLTYFIVENEKTARAYIKHLFDSNEILGAILVTLHNIAFYTKLAERARESIKKNEFTKFKKEVLEFYDS